MTRRRVGYCTDPPTQERAIPAGIDKPSAQPSGPSIAGLVFVLVTAALVRFGVVWAADVRAPFGPDAPGIAAAAGTDPLGHPYPLHPLLVAALTPLAQGEPDQAALVLSLLAGVALAGAGWTLGQVMLGDVGARTIGAIIACAPLLVYPSLLGAGDAPALALATWGAALAWKGAGRLGSLEGLPREAAGFLPSGFERRARTLLVLGCLLWGLSAAVKPIALPVGILLAVVPAFGGRRTLPWLLLGLVPGVCLALPFLAPFLRPRPAMGLLGSWWMPAPPDSLGAWLTLPVRGVQVLWDSEGTSPWWLVLPTFVLALYGGLCRGYRVRERRVLLVAGTLAMVLLAGMLGDRLRPRYLAGALLPWLVLCGVGAVPWRYRQTVPARLQLLVKRAVYLESLPLSLTMTLFIVSSFRFWDGMGHLRTREEGAAPARAWLEGWAEATRPVDDYVDCSVCGGLELERVARNLAETLPRDAVVLAVPLRDGRTWTLAGPLARLRPDVHVFELDEGCCPGPAAACADRIPAALGATGGVVVVPRLPEGRCETGAVPPDREPLRALLATDLDDGGTWFGVRRVGADASGGSDDPEPDVCGRLGGRSPHPPALPWEW